jgi:hypothetical protein
MTLGMKSIELLLGCIGPFVGLTGGLLLAKWKERRRDRRLAAEEAERILLAGTRMETRTFLDTSSRVIVAKQVPVGSPFLPGQQITAADFNRLDERIKALENRRPR